MVGRVLVDRYKIVRLLAVGGTSQIFLADQLDQKRQVVVKVLAGEEVTGPDFRDLLQREMELMRRFHHPHAVQFYEAALDARVPCLILEYVPGETLAQVLRGVKKMSPSRVGRLLGQLCAALEAAHLQSIIHRDIKPGNIMLAEPGTPNETLKLLDLGLAKLTGNLAGGPYFSLADFKRKGAGISGTPEYMCPEQIRGNPIDQRGDLYSVGVTLFEMLTGSLPYIRPDVTDLLRAHLHEEPFTFEELNAGDVPELIQDIVYACMAKDPQDRPASARQLAEYFQSALGEDIVLNQAVASAEDTPCPSSRTAPDLANVKKENPLAVTIQLNAWMPEQIAVMKLRGCLPHIGGEVIHTEPGKLRIRLFRKWSAKPSTQRGILAWLGFGSASSANDQLECTEMELHMENTDPRQPSLLALTAILHPPANSSTQRIKEWRRYCERIGGELSAYLMAKK